MKKIQPKSLLSCSLLGTLTAMLCSLICILIFAFVIKIFNMPNNAINIINQIIKIVSIMLGVIVAVNHNKEKGFLKGLIIGLCYTIVAFVIFSILSKNFNFGKSLFNDILFGCISGIICGVIAVNIKPKTA